MNWKSKFPKSNRYFETSKGILYNGDSLAVLKTLLSESVDTVITSPPYWMKRNYGVEGQLGLEPDFHEYLEHLWVVFDEVYRVLKPSGTLWVNIGDTYFSKSKRLLVKITQKYPVGSLCMIPSRFAEGMIDRGWTLKNRIIWKKPNTVPESVKRRFTVDYEHIFFFVKSRSYYFKQQLEPYSLTSDVKYRIALRAKKQYNVKEPYKNNTPYMRRKQGKEIPEGRNKRAVWTIPTRPSKGIHPATFPPDIPRICIEAGCPEKGIVLDPFIGSGTSAEVAEGLGRRWVGIDISANYCKEIKTKEVIRL